MDTIAIADNALHAEGDHEASEARWPRGRDFIVLGVACLSVANTLSLISGFGGVCTQSRVINFLAAWTLAAMPLLLWSWRACTSGFVGGPVSRIACGVVGCISTVAAFMALTLVLVMPLLMSMFWWDAASASTSAAPPWQLLPPLLSLALLLLAWLGRNLPFGRAVRLVAWAAAWSCSVAFSSLALLLAPLMFR